MTIALRIVDRWNPIPLRNPRGMLQAGAFPGVFRFIAVAGGSRGSSARDSLAFWERWRLAAARSCAADAG